MKNERPENSLEMNGQRYLPGMKGAIALEHLHRYALACRFAKGKNVLDIACGEGYGAMMLAGVAQRVIGVDISPEAIIHAAGKYGRDNLDFNVGSCAEIPLKEASVDLVVCFETIEHHDRHEAMMREFVRVLRRDGLCIISSPDKYAYSDVPRYRNPFHVKELYRDEFERLVSHFFENVETYGQRVIYGSGIFVDKNVGRYMHFVSVDEGADTDAESFCPVYNIAVASNGHLPEAINGFLEQPVWESEIVQSLFSDKAQAMNARDEALQEKEAAIRERDEAVRVQSEALGARDEALKEKDAVIRERDEAVRVQMEVLKDRDEALKEKDAAVRERDDALKVKREALEARDEALREKDAVIRDGAQAFNELKILLRSHSWRLTGPLRGIRRKVVTAPYRLFRRLASDSARSTWYHLPFSFEKKQILKAGIFKAFPFIFRHTVAYRAWEEFVKNRKGHSEFKGPSNTVVKPDPNTLNEAIVHPVPLIDENPLDRVPVRVIAFYLPQFHPIPENDKWWGEGFTEWTNVKRATPQFGGHAQPRKPGELGYYDLRDTDVQRRQVELAKLYGISGFSFYFYWFSGKRLLELPIERYLENRELDLPFCLCWANENWSRRWDGLNHKILIEQEHSPEDDLKFIAYVSRYLKDPRYIRIQGRPILIVYRPGLLPSAKKTAKRWRKWCRENGLGEIFLAYTQAFECVDPKHYGFDAAIEFPPNNMAPPVITERVKGLVPDFSGIIYDWGALVERSRHYRPPDFKLFRGVCPSWDNTPRRMKKAGIFLGSTPDKYRKWLENASADTVRRFSDSTERLVFVNGWNEWAEGAYLEPDERCGYGYLQATRDALKKLGNKNAERRIVLVAHDAHPHGAQYLILHVAKTLVEDLGFTVDMVVLGDGPLLNDYGRYARLHRLKGRDAGGEEAKVLAAQLFDEGVRFTIANSTVSGLFVKALKEQGFHVIALIHELPGLIKDYGLQPHVKSIVECAERVVFPARQVLEGFGQFDHVEPRRAVILPQGLFRRNPLRSEEQVREARKALRSRFGLSNNAQVVLCIAYGDYRKGVDLFVEIGLKVTRTMPNVFFLWVGHFDSRMEQHINNTLNSSKLSDRFIFPGLDFESDLYYAGSDVFALTSREDPFPSVVLEALDANLPVIAFDDVGGFKDLLSRGGGRLIPPFETDAFAKGLIGLLSEPDKAHALGVSGSKIVEREFSFRRYVFDLLNLVHAPLRRVSVIVPNFNYARYLVDRIKTIVSQEYPIYELIILDDASGDRSVDIINEIAADLPIDCRVVLNEINSGNPFVQWLKGVELARGDYIWIAEADDLSEPGFLDEVLQAFEDPSVVMSYCQSKQMGSDGRIICNDYLDYVSDVSTKKWLEYYVEDGLDEIRNCLAVKNTIPNVSAVVFKKSILLSILKERIDEIKVFQIAGDWKSYIYILEYGKIAYSPKSFNLHRRHKNSRTLGHFDLMQLEEILDIQQAIQKTYNPDKKILKKAHDYSQRLYREFAPGSSHKAMMVEHSKLAAYFDS